MEKLRIMILLIVIGWGISIGVGVGEKIKGDLNKLEKALTLVSEDVRI